MSIMTETATRKNRIPMWYWYNHGVNTKEQGAFISVSDTPAGRKVRKQLDRAPSPPPPERVVHSLAAAALGFNRTLLELAYVAAALAQALGFGAFEAQFHAVAPATGPRTHADGGEAGAIRLVPGTGR